MREELARIVGAKDNEERLVQLQRLASTIVQARLKEGSSPWRGNELQAAQPLDGHLETALVQLFHELQDARAKSSLVFILGEMGGGNSVSAIADFLRAATGKDQRLVAVDALGKIGGPEVVLILREYAEKDPDELVRGFTVQALFHLGENALAGGPLRRVPLGDVGDQGAAAAEFVEQVALKDVSLYVREMAEG